MILNDVNPFANAQAEEITNSNINMENEDMSDVLKEQVEELKAELATAKEAAKVLGFQRLRDSLFPTLDKLLDASKLLKKNWSRNKNYVVKK